MIYPLRLGSAQLDPALESGSPRGDLGELQDCSGDRGWRHSRGHAGGQVSAGLVRLTVYQSFDGPTAPLVKMPRTSLVPGELAVIVNDAEPVSRVIGPEYAARRGIGQVVHIDLPATSEVVDPAAFAPAAGLSESLGALPDLA